MAPPPPDRWIDEGPIHDAATRAVRRASDQGPSRAERRRRNRAEAALELDSAELARRLGRAGADRARRDLNAAADAFAAGRWHDAQRALVPLVDLLPDAPAVRELAGLALYRMGRWRSAAEHLASFTELTGSTEQHPVLADCYRALGRHRRVEELWEELAAESPSAALVAEGRIVTAGSRADRGDVAGAIGLLENAALGSSRLAEHHLRLRYALADLHERGGDPPRARTLFASVVAADPGFADAAARLSSL